MRWPLPVAALLGLLVGVPVNAQIQPEARAAGSWPFWSHYAERFVSSQGRVIDPDRNEMTTSEGQSYAMFFALVAGDGNAFEKLRSWTEENLARGDLAKNLPAWSWGRKNDGSWGVLDPNSASDSDLWIAYSLIEAGEIWTKPNYSRTGKALLAEIAQAESTVLPQVGAVLLPGRSGFHPDTDHWVLNPSYSPLPLLLAAHRAAPDGPWKAMSTALPVWLRQASPSGFAMDWVGCSEGTGFSAVAGPGNSPKAPQGSYDAIRVYLWAGMTPKEAPGAAELLKIFAPMATYVKAHMAPPEMVAPDGNILSVTAPPGFSAAMVPFLMSLGDKETAAMQLRNVNAQFDSSTGLLGSPPRYYDQNLALFALGWQEKRFQFAPDGTLRVQWKK
jgi:endo-1,4-beta-D-glucanase Y